MASAGKKSPKKQSAPKARDQASGGEGAGPDALELLKSQHREVEELFEKLEDAGDNAVKQKQQIFAAIAHKLECHAQIEERIFYPEGREVDEDTTLEAYEEHGVVRFLIDAIKGTDPSDETFKAKATVLKEVVEHHVEEEEDEFFPKMKKALGKERLKELGAELQAEFERLDAELDPELEARKLPAKRAAATRKKARV
jgi:hemerythrin-like domain-containing protein